jgi:hypothetical protein
MRSWITPSRRPAALLAVTLAGLAGGIGARLAGEEALAGRVLALTVVAGLLPLAVSVAGALPRRPCGGGTGPTGPGRVGHPSLGRPPAAP